MSDCFMMFRGVRLFHGNKGCQTISWQQGTSDCFMATKDVNFMATRDVRLLHDSMGFIIRLFHNNKWRERESVSVVWRDVSVALMSLRVHAGSFGVTGCFISFRKHGCKLGIHDYCLCHFISFSVCMHVCRLVCG